MKKQSKIDLIGSLKGQLSSAKSVILVNYTGLSVKNQQELKKRLSGVSSTMVVVKNTLLKIAGKEAKLAEELLTDEVMSGQTALVISLADPIAPLQVLAKFAKEFEIPQLKVGIIDGSFQDKTGLIRLSKLPSKEVLFAQTVGMIASPMYSLVGSLEGNVQKLLWILRSKSGSN